MNPSRARLAFAAGATVVLGVVVVAVALSSSSGDGDTGSANECLIAWNEDAVARSDGIHAYGSHGYRATLIGRVDGDGTLAASAEGDAGRCAVVFAAPRVDREPDFGVRVLDDGHWTGLALSDRVALNEVEAMQREATATANATLLPDGRLAED